MNSRSPRLVHSRSGCSSATSVMSLVTGLFILQNKKEIMVRYFGEYHRREEGRWGWDEWRGGIPNSHC